MNSEIMEIPVNLKELASDIIVATKEGYKNLMTGKISYEFSDCVRNKKFLFDDGEYYAYDKNKLFGHCAVHNKEFNVLLIIHAVFDYPSHNEWIETGRYAFYWKDKRLHVTDNFYPIAYIYDIDICGQTIGFIGEGDYNMIQNTDFGLEKRPVKTGFFHDEESCPVYSGFIKETFSFLNQTPYLSYNEQFKYENSAVDSITMLESLAEYAIEKKIRKASLTENRKCFQKDCPPLPDIAYDIMKKYAIEEVKAGSLQSFWPIYVDNYVNSSNEFNCIQNVEGKVVVRTFSAFVEQKFPIDSSTVYIQETMRYELIPGQYFKAIMCLGDTAWVDDLTGTFMEYQQGLIKKWTDILEQILFSEDKERKLPLKPYERVLQKAIKLSDAYKDFRENTEVAPANVMIFAETMANSAFFEKLYNTGNKKLQEYLYDHLYLYRSGDKLKQDFGEMYEGKTIYSMLGIPKGLFDEAIKNNVKIIGYAKSLFLTNKGKNYLARMNNDDGKILAKFFIRKWPAALKLSIESIQILILLYGHKNWKGYIKHVEKIESEGISEIEKYRDYLNMLLCIGSAAKDADWKLSGNALTKAKESLVEAYDDVKNKGGLINKKISLQQEKLKKYAYADDEFIVKYPKKQEDIIREGVALHHCAKEFINKVADGETILLFIRKKAYPYKPFYTLEIRNEEIRQCHGFDNRNICEANGLIPFLKKYCEEKNIVFTGLEACGRLLGEDF